MRLALAVLLVLGNLSCKGPVDKDGNPITVGRLRLRTFPTGAKVWIDGVLKIDETPATLILPAGRYHLKMQLAPAEPLEKDSTLEAGDSLDRTYRIPAPPDATVTVLADVEGAGVRINGWPRGYTPLRSVITHPGPLDITVTNPDGRAKSIQGALAYGEQKVVEVTFGPRPPPEEDEPKLEAPAPERFGRLTLGAKPKAEVFDAEGRSLGKTPLVEQKIPAGKHVLTIKALKGTAQKTVEIEVEPDKTAVYRFAID